MALLDHDMPGLDGTQTAAALRASGFPGAIVGLTAGVDTAEAMRWRQIGCEFILPKGLGPTAISSRRASLLDRTRTAPARDADRRKGG